MSSFDGDSEVSLKGTYTSPTNNVFAFNVAGHENPYILGFVKGVSATIATLIPSYKMTGTIKMNEDEFQFFKNEVLDKNVPWKFRGGVVIPGTWSTSVSVGGKRSSCRRSSCRRSSCRRSSCRRSSCRRRGHRRTKHH